MFITFFNGESFSSDSTRIKFLSSGKLSLEFIPIEVTSCLCRREKSCDLLNLLFCYKATVFNIEFLISLFSFIIFLFTIFLFAYIFKQLPIHVEFISYWLAGVPLLISVYCFLLGLCCEDCCCKNRTPGWKKFCVIIAIIITFALYPFEIIGLPISVGTLNGKINFRADCDIKVEYHLDKLDIYKSLCFDDYENNIYS